MHEVVLMDPADGMNMWRGDLKAMLVGKREAGRRSTHTLFERAVLAVKGTIAEVSVENAFGKDFVGAVLVDIREGEERHEGWPPNALHIPRGLLERDIELAVPSFEQRIVLMCSDGNRALLAASTLKSMGYRYVLVLAGGWDRARKAFNDSISPRRCDGEPRG